MVTMSSGFTLPPVIRRFGRCGDWEEQRMSSSNSVTPELGESPPHGRRGTATGTDRVKSFVNGIVGPFAACLAPAGPCGPGCTSDKYFDKQPSVVSPHLDRVIAYRDSRAEQHDPDDYYIRRHPSHHAHQHHRSPTNYHRPSKPVSSPTYPREPAAEESATDKKKRSTDIAKPRSNDILCGRGGSSNRHLGNIHFRELVAANKQIYVGLTKKQKMLVARKIVDAIHSTGGRFLAKDLDTGMFYDIGLPRSLEKTSQALREKHSNEMPVAQPSGEDEGIETSVESHKELIKKETTTSKDETKGAATEESPSKESSPDATPSSKSAKKSTMEAPDLIIPPHLMNKFGPKGSGAHEEEWENNHAQSLSPRSYVSDQPIRSPYPPSPYHTPSAASPTKGYPPHPPPPHHRHARYPTSPVPTNGSQPYPPPHYYYPPHTPPYGRRPPPDDRYRYPPYDGEAYNADYYKRHPHAQYHRYPRSHPPHHGHPSPPPPPRGAPPPPRPAAYGQPPTSAPPPLPTFRPSPYYRGYEGSEQPPPAMPASPPNRVIYRNSNSGYIRGNTDLSPGRQRELKRPRNSETSDALSSAVKQSLSLDDRVVGKEREKLKKMNSTSNTSSGSSSPFADIVSPTTMLQTKTSGRGVAVHDRNSSPTETKEDYSALSGLAALSTAAFLKLDEDDK